MKKLVILGILLVSMMGYSQISLVDSTIIYRTMPSAEKLMTITDFEEIGIRLDSLSDKYNEKKFVLKIYYKDNTDENGNETDEYRQRVYVSTFSRKN